jgi:hypothetical protein
MPQGPEDYQTLRSVLDRAGYSDQAVAGIMQINSTFLRSRDLPALLYNTRQESVLDILARLFLMELPVKLAQLKTVVDPKDLEQWLEAGLIREDGPWVLAVVRLYPFQGYLFASDIEERVFSSEGSDFVMGIATSSVDLLNITVRRHSRLTLDLGTGCGVQALFAARHSDRVLAVDSNPRAVKMAVLNSALNNISNVECREGHLFEPVRGNKFDLIVTNPPFVISPEVRFLFRDGGGHDNVCLDIVRQAPAFLEEGGFFQMVCNWPEHTGEDWKTTMAGWFEGSGCDVWVKRTDRIDPGAYASLWLRATEKLSKEEHAHRFTQWIDFFEENRIDAIGSGFIVMQRTGREKTWFEADADPWQVTRPSGDSIENRFCMRAFLESFENQDRLLDLRVGASPDTQLEQQWAPSDKGWTATGAKLRLSKGLHYEGEVDGSVARFITSCDGEKTLRDLLFMMASSSNADPDTIKPKFLALARRFIETGFIVPVGGVIENACLSPAW